MKTLPILATFLAFTCLGCDISSIFDSAESSWSSNELNELKEYAVTRVTCPDCYVRFEELEVENPADPLLLKVKEVFVSSEKSLWYYTDFDLHECKIGFVTDLEGPILFDLMHPSVASSLELKLQFKNEETSRVHFGKGRVLKVLARSEILLNEAGHKYYLVTIKFLIKQMGGATVLIPGEAKLPIIYDQSEF